MSVNTQNKYLPNIKLNKSNAILHTYTSEKILVVGETSVDVCYNKQVKTLKLYVVDREGPSLFGSDWLRLDWKTTGLTTAEVNESCVNPVLERYSDVFSTELETIKDIKAKLEVKPDTIPLFKIP